MLSGATPHHHVSVFQLLSSCRGESGATFTVREHAEHTPYSTKSTGNKTLKRSGCRMSDSRSGVGDVFLKGGERNLALDSFRLRLRTQVDVHHVASQRLRAESGGKVSGSTKEN